MRSVVTFVWEGTRRYGPSHVNLLQSQVSRHLTGYRFVCVTDYPADGFSSDVDVVKPPEKVWKRLRSLRTLEGPRFPSSYPRLLGLSEWAKCLGEKILVLDVDCLVLGSLAPYFERDEDFVGWRPSSLWGRSPRIGGGTWFHRTGTLTHIWDRFWKDPKQEILRARADGYRGSDQALLSRWFASQMPYWTVADGIYQAQDGVFNWTSPPPDARIVHMNGDRVKPWTSKQQWVKEALYGC